MIQGSENVSNSIAKENLTNYILALHVRKVLKLFRKQEIDKQGDMKTQYGR